MRKLSCRSIHAEAIMHDTVLPSNLDSFLVAIPFLIILLIGYFRLDEVFAAPKHRVRARRAPCGIDEDGQPILCDPDGRRWNAARPLR
jgi:hypothetical protein